MVLNIPRACMSSLVNFFIKKWFNRAKVDTNLFIKRKAKYILLVQTYVDDIKFGSFDEFLCEELASMIHGGVRNVVYGINKFFLGLDIK